MSFRDISQDVFWKLPYSFRQKLFPITNPTRYRNFKHKMENVDEFGYSFTSFYKKKIIFVHIPKCGGISINESICGNLGGGHIPAKNYQLIMPKADFDNFFKFSFVRNPWDRLFSAYNFLQTGGMTKNDKDFAKKNILPYSNFQDFIMNWVNEKNIKNAIHFVPQHKFICGQDGKILVDFIGRFERMNTDYKKISAKIGFEISPLQFLNKSNGKKNYKEQYTSDMRQKVEKVYQKDIELLDYDF